jgi:nucleoside-diphosphate-sugar epimerase
MLERLTEFARLADWHGRLRRAPAAELPEADRLLYDFRHHPVYDTSRIRHELGYAEVVPHEISLTRTLEIERLASH